MNLIEEAGQDLKLYGLGAFEQGLIDRINEAINLFLCGVPDENQIGLMDQLNEGGLSFELQ